MSIALLPEILGACCGLAGVVLANSNNPLSWWFQLPACLLYSWVFYEKGLIADSLLQIWFFVSSISGLLNWSKTENRLLPITRMSSWEWPRFVVLNVLGIGVLYFALIPFGQARWLATDVLCAVLSVSAQRLLVQRKLENWFFWIVVNNLYLWLYWQSQLYYTFVFYCLLLLLAFRGWRQWKRLLATATD